MFLPIHSIVSTCSVDHRLLPQIPSFYGRSITIKGYFGITTAIGHASRAVRQRGRLILRREKFDKVTMDRTLNHSDNYKNPMGDWPIFTKALFVLKPHRVHQPTWQSCRFKCIQLGSSFSCIHSLPPLHTPHFRSGRINGLTQAKRYALWCR
jgi:hypothetical protein